MWEWGLHDRISVLIRKREREPKRSCEHDDQDGEFQNVTMLASWSWTWVSKSQKINYCCLSRPIYGSLLWQHKLTRTNTMYLTEAETGLMQLQAEEYQWLTAISRTQGKGRKDSTHSLGGSMALLTPWFWISSLQDSGRINFCSFKPPVLLHSV